MYGTVDDARARLASVEERAGSTSATAGGAFVNNTAPRYVADAFAEAARSKAVLSNVFPVEPLPDTGLDVYTARITTGLVAGVQATQNSSLGTQDIVEAKTQASPVATIAGYVDFSIQVDERADPAYADVVMARDLGSAIGSALDLQLLTGLGTSAQLLGLISVTGIGTTAYTDASPTQAECSPP